jgi:7-keto-8-aminopelargonate synthetase-like enzyme
VSETLFSMDGDLADVETLAALCARHDAALMLDEAHALGARGPEGRGVAAGAGVVPDVLVGTCGKALGGFGAFAATTPAVAELLWNRARPLVFSTALPPAIAAAVTAAVGVVRSSEGDERRAALADHARLVRARIARAGGHADSAIAPIVVGDDRRVMEISARVLEQRIFVQGIRPPTVPAGSARLRVSLSATHDLHELERAMSVLDDAVRQ